MFFCSGGALTAMKFLLGPNGDEGIAATNTYDNVVEYYYDFRYKPYPFSSLKSCDIVYYIYLI